MNQRQDRTSRSEQTDYGADGVSSFLVAETEFTALREAGCTAAQVERLVRLRERVVRGDVGGGPSEERRLGFLRWLIDQGKLSDN